MRLINTPGDRYEREADDLADKVMRVAEPMTINAASPAIQRRCADCEEREEKLIKTMRMPAAPTGDELGASAAASAATRGGTPLSTDLRAYFEPRFGHDFRDVRIHSDANAAESARSRDARAYTLGNDIVFGQDEYKPHMPSGQHLLAHELTHVVQQSTNTAARACIQRAVRINNGAQRVNEAEYQAGGARSNVGSRFRVSALIADSVRRTFADVAELEQYANGRTDNIGDVTTGAAGVFWYRLPNNQVTVLGEQHQNPQGNVEDVILGVHTSRFMYEPFNEIAQVGGLSPQFSGTQSRLSQLNQQYRVSSQVNRRSFNPDLENIVIKALTGAQVFRNQFLPANPRTMGAAQQQAWGRRPSTSAYSFGERVALYLTTGIHIAQDLAQRPQGPPTAAEANLVFSGDALAAFYRTNQGVLDGIMRTKDADDLIGIYELTAPGNFSVLPVLNTFAVLMHAYASQYIQRLGAQTGNAALTSEGQALERNPGATLNDLSPAREEIMWNRLQQAIAGGYLIVGMGDAHRQNLTPRLNAAGIPHEEVAASLRRQQTAVNGSWRP